MTKKIMALDLNRLCAPPKKVGTVFQQQVLEEQIFQGNQAATILAAEDKQEAMMSFIVNFAISVLRVLDGTIPIKAIQKNLSPKCLAMIEKMSPSFDLNSRRYQVRNVYVQTGVLGSIYSTAILETQDHQATLVFSLVFLYNLETPILQNFNLSY
jgi:hypothetical protein